MLENNTRELAALREALCKRQPMPQQLREEEPAPMDVVAPERPVGKGVSRRELREVMGELQREMMANVGNMVAARLEGLEVDGRLLPGQSHRPPLAASYAQAVQRKPQGTAPQQRQQPPKQAAPPAAPAPQPSKKGKKKKGKAKTSPKPGAPTTLTPPANMPKKAKGAKSPQTSQPKPGPSASQAPATTVPSAEEGWTVVERQKKKKTLPLNAKGAKPAAPKKRKRTRKRGPKAPSTPAVVVALKPEALGQGMTYSEVIARAKTSVSLDELGIGPAKFKTAITGARIMELPKATTAEKAELLAAKLGEAIGDVAKVTRPVKTADIRLTGLDDSVRETELAGALAAVGQCPIAHIKVGKIHVGKGGTGAAFASVPVEAARRLDRARTIRVGWSSAQVRLMESGPMRCYRCLGMGHPVQRCPSATDRSGLCYRCGSDGHKAATCSAPYKCVVCAEAKRPSNHRMGGRKCNPPPAKGRGTAAKPASVPTMQSPRPSSATAAEELMDTANVQ